MNYIITRTCSNYYDIPYNMKSRPLNKIKLRFITPHTVLPKHLLPTEYENINNYSGVQIIKKKLLAFQKQVGNFEERKDVTTLLILMCWLIVT